MTIAVNCTDDISNLVKATNQFGTAGQKVFSVYSEEDLVDKTKVLQFPAIGVMYEGMRADGGDPSDQGMSANVQVALVLMLDGTVLGLDMKNVAANMLDVCRKKIRMQRSPTGHKWRFIQEIPAGRIGRANGYVQRWQTKVILTAG